MSSAVPRGSLHGYEALAGAWVSAACLMPVPCLLSFAVLNSVSVFDATLLLFPYPAFESSQGFLKQQVPGFEL